MPQRGDRLTFFADAITRPSASSAVMSNWNVAGAPPAMMGKCALYMRKSIVSPSR